MSFSVSATSNSQATATIDPYTGKASVTTDSTSTISGEGNAPGKVNASATGDASASLEAGGVKLSSDSASHVDYSSRGYKHPKPPCYHPPVFLKPFEL